MFDAYVWTNREKLLIAYEKRRKQAVSDLEGLKHLRFKLMMTTLCRGDNQGWFRKVKWRSLTLEEANFKWDTPNYNVNVDERGVWTSGRDFERERYEHKVDRFAKMTDLLMILKEEEIFVSLEDMNEIKEYL